MCGRVVDVFQELRRPAFGSTHQSNFKKEENDIKRPVNISPN